MQTFHKNERKKLLEKLDGWVWQVETTKEDVWLENLNFLKEYVDEKKKLPPSREKIGTWMRTQRTNYKKGKLSIARTKFLEEIDIWVW